MVIYALVLHVILWTAIVAMTFSVVFGVVYLAPTAWMEIRDFTVRHPWPIFMLIVTMYHALTVVRIEAPVRA